MIYLKFFLVFFVNFIFALIVFFAADNSPLASISLIACVVIFSFMYSLSCVSNSSGVLSFSILGYLGYGLLFPALYQVRTTDYFWGSSLGDAFQNQAAILVLVFFICLLMSYMYFDLKEAKKMSKMHKLNSSSIFHMNSSLKTLKAAWLTYLISLLLLIYIIDVIGIVSFFIPRGSFIALFKNSSSFEHLDFLITIARSTGVGLLIIAFEQLKTSKGWSSFFLMLSVILFNCVVNFPLSSPRYYMIAIFIVILFYRGLFEKNKTSIYLMAPLMIMSFPFFGAFNRGEEFNFELIDRKLFDYLSHADFDGFQSIQNVMNLTAQDGYSFGLRLISSLFFFIPRSIWESKAMPTGTDAAAAADYTFLNISMPLPAEFYADFGFFGVVLIAIIIGKIIVLRVERFNYSIFTRSILISMAAFSPIVLRGTLLATIQCIFVVFVLILIWKTSTKLLNIRF
jgi:hypothetical protein